METDETLPKKKTIKKTRILEGPEQGSTESPIASSTPEKEAIQKDKSRSEKEEEEIENEEEIEEQEDEEATKEERLWRLMEKMAAKKSIGKIKPFTGKENLDKWF